MDVSLIAPENEMFPGRKRWTRKECEKLAAAGVLPERYELIDGVIISKMSQNPPHSVTLNLIVRWLTLLFGIDFLRNQEPITIPGRSGKANDPQPDIAITVGLLTDYAARHPIPSETVLLVEVADTSLRYDKGTKALLYAKVGVKEYWVADITGRQIIRRRRPKQTGYAEIVTLGAEDSISPEGRSEETICVGDLFPPAPAKSA